MSLVGDTFAVKNVHLIQSVSVYYPPLIQPLADRIPFPPPPLPARFSGVTMLPSRLALCILAQVVWDLPIH